MGAQCSAPKNPHELEAKEILEEHLGEGTTAALSKLAAVLMQTNEKVFRTPSKHPVLVNLGMIMSQCKQEERYKQPLAHGKPFTDMAVLMKAARYARYAAAAYCSEQEDILKTIHGGEEDVSGNVELLHVHSSSTKTPPSSSAKRSTPNFFIAFDKASGDVVLSIRGTATMREAITEAVAEVTPFLDGTAHEGLLARSKELITSTKEPLENALKNSPNGSLAIVGHSIGGAIAILATLQAFGENSGVEQLLAAGRAKCYAFAPPPVLEPVGKLPAQRATQIYSFVNNMDCVPRACLGTVGKLLLAVRKVDELDMDMPARLQFLKGGSDSSEICPDHEEIPEELIGELKMFQGVGTVVLFQKGEDGKMRCEAVPPELDGRLLIHPDMVKNHEMAGYEEAITETLMQFHRSKGCC